jgi:hypothetical protein
LRLYVEEDAMQIGPQHNRVRILENKKSNEGPDGGQIRLRWNDAIHIFAPIDGGDTVEAIKRTIAQKEFADRLLAKLRQMIKDRIPLSPSKSSNTHYFAKRCRRDGIKGSDEAFETALQFLVGEKLIRIVTHGRVERLALPEGEEVGNA